MLSVCLSVSRLHCFQTSLCVWFHPLSQRLSDLGSPALNLFEHYRNLELEVDLPYLLFQDSSLSTPKSRLPRTVAVYVVESPARQPLPLLLGLGTAISTLCPPVPGDSGSIEGHQSTSYEVLPPAWPSLEDWDHSPHQKSGFPSWTTCLVCPSAPLKHPCPVSVGSLILASPLSPSPSLSLSLSLLSPCSLCLGFCLCLSQ